ncbi:MAG: hypothetical protein KF746_14175 [Chitinophagaceae bacterium]|nr:hypothetical protein [Chitinophagaceae bacterium]
MFLLTKYPCFGRQAGNRLTGAFPKQESYYGRNFTGKNVRRMIQFSELFPDLQIVVTLSRQFSWSHFGV